MNLPDSLIWKNYLKNYVLFEFEKYFNRNSTSLSDYNLPLLDKYLIGAIDNMLLLEELSYDVEQLKKDHHSMIGMLNA